MAGILDIADLAVDLHITGDGVVNLTPYDVTMNQNI